MGGPIQFRLKARGPLLLSREEDTCLREVIQSKSTGLSTSGGWVREAIPPPPHPPPVSQFFTHIGRKTVHKNILFFNDEGCKTMEDSRALHEIEEELSYKKRNVCFTFIRYI
jgi:hypothetical protein